MSEHNGSRYVKDTKLTTMLEKKGLEKTQEQVILQIPLKIGTKVVKAESKEADFCLSTHLLNL